MIASLSSVAIALAIASVASADLLSRDVVEDLEIRQPEPWNILPQIRPVVPLNPKQVLIHKYHTKTRLVPTMTKTVYKSLKTAIACKAPTKTVTKTIRPTFTKTVVLVNKKKHGKHLKKHRKFRKNRKHGKKHRKHRKHYYARSPEPEPLSDNNELNNLD